LDTLIMTVPWEKMIISAGIGELGLVAASLAIPRALRWQDDLAKLRPLTRQVFWVYAAYIWCTNLAFGLISAFAPRWLLDRTPLAGAVSAYIATYWGARLVIQFTYFDRSDMPKEPLFGVGETALVGLFLLLTLVYGALALRAFGVLGP
jgi:hypothetical protein